MPPGSEDDDIKAIARASAKRRAAIEAANSAPSGRSEVEKVASPTLAERILPGHPEGQQHLRQAVDTGTSALGGFLGGGPIGAMGGAAASLLSGAFNPNQAQEIGSLTNVANVALPGVAKGVRALGPVAEGAKNSPILANALLSGAEGVASGAATGVDTGSDVGLTALVGGGLSSIFGGGAGYFQSRGQELPASISHKVRKALSGLSEQVSGRLPAGASASGLLDTFTNQMSRLSPFLRSPEKELEERLAKTATVAQLGEATKAVPKAQTAAKAAETKLTNLQKQAAVDEAEMAHAVGLERARSKDFLRSFPDQAEAMDAEIARLQKDPKRYTPAGEATFKQAVDSRKKLQQEYELAVAGSGSEAALRERVTKQKELAGSDYTKLVRDAALQSSTASKKFQEARSEVNRLASAARSFVTRDKVREEALDALVATNVRDPRLFTPEAQQTVRALVKDPKFSPQSLFEKTLEAKDGSEMMTRGLMDAIGNDPATKTALRTRYTQHVFDKFQQGADTNVYGKTFKPDEFVKYVQGINPRSFNNFMESPDAYGVLYSLSERLRKSAEGAGSNHMLGITVGSSAVGLGAYAGSRMVSSDGGGDEGGFWLKIAGAAAGGAALSRLISWKHVTNKLLQADSKTAKNIREFLDADDPTRLSTTTVKSALKVLLSGSKPAPEEETPAETNVSQP